MNAKRKDTPRASRIQCLKHPAIKGQTRIAVAVEAKEGATNEADSKIALIFTDNNLYLDYICMTFVIFLFELKTKRQLANCLQPHR